MSNKQKAIIIVSVCLVVVAVIGTACFLSKQAKEKNETTTEKVTEKGFVEEITEPATVPAIGEDNTNVTKVEDILAKDKDINMSAVDFGTVGVTSGTRVAQSRVFTTKANKK